MSEEADEFSKIRLFKKCNGLNMDDAFPLPLIVQKISTKFLKNVPDVNAFVLHW